MSARRLAKMIGPFLGPLRTARVAIISGDISGAATSTAAFTVLNCDDDPDYDLISNGSTVAECHPGSRIVGFQLKTVINLQASGRGAHWIFYRDPDGAIGTAEPTSIFTMDISSAITMLRKNTMKYGFIRTSTGTDTAAMTPVVKKVALKRARLMADGDKLKFSIDTFSGDHASATFDCVGRIWFR